MSEMEKMVWAAAFAVEWKSQLDRLAPTDTRPWKNVSGFSCAELADEALLKFREAMRCDDKEHLLPIKEGWVL